MCTLVKPALQPTTIASTLDIITCSTIVLQSSRQAEWTENIHMFVQLHMMCRPKIHSSFMHASPAS